MHDSKVGVVAFYKICASLLCTFFGFFKNVPLDGVKIFFCKIHMK